MESITVDVVLETLNKFTEQMPRNLDRKSHALLQQAVQKLLDRVNSENLLYRWANDPMFKTYSDIDAVITALAGNSDRIYIYIEDVNIYKAFKDSEEFAKFMHFVLPDTNLAYPRGDIQKYQIVTTTSRQKLVLTYNGNQEDIAKEICDQAANYFGKNVQINENPTWKLSQIVIDKLVENYSDGVKHREQFCDYLKSKGRNIGNTIKTAPLEQHCSGIQYTTPLVRHLNLGNMNDFEASLITNAKVVNINLINNGTINININQNKPIDKKTTTATEWVKNNLPADHENQKEYLNKYLNHCKDKKISPVKRGFKKIVRDFGYTEGHSDSTYYWNKDE